MSRTTANTLARIHQQALEHLESLAHPPHIDEIILELERAAKDVSEEHDERPARKESRRGPHRQREEGDPIETSSTATRDRSSTLLTVTEVADRLGIGRSLAYELISKGELRSMKIGRARRIHPDEVRAYVNRQQLG